MRSWFNHIFGYRYFWRVSLTYRDRFGKILMTTFVTMYSPSPDAIGRPRKAKQAIAHHLIENVPRALLCNGRIDFQPVCYLGWWRE